MANTSASIMKNHFWIKRRWLSRVGWLIIIWLLSVAVLYVIAFLIRLLMTAAGMH